MQRIANRSLFDCQTVNHIGVTSFLDSIVVTFCSRFKPKAEIRKFKFYKSTNQKSTLYEMPIARAIPFVNYC